MKRGGAALARAKGVAWAGDGSHAVGTPRGLAGPVGGHRGDAEPCGDAGRAGVRAWWRGWRGRFGLAEVCGTLAAIGGFAAGYLTAGSLLAAAGLATVCEAIGFYGCIGWRTVAAAGRATSHLGRWHRLAAGAWHAVREQLASCAVAEVLDGLLVRPGCLAGAAWLMRSLPGGLWLGFAVGKAAADAAWYGMEACARRGVARSVAAIRAENAVPAPRAHSEHCQLDVDEWSAAT